MVDGQGRIVFANARLSEMFGYSRSWLVGRMIETLLPSRLHTIHRRERRAFQAKPERRSMGLGRELMARRKGGTEFPVEISLSPIVSDEGTVTMALVTDITDRVEANKAMERSARQYRQLLESLAGGAVTVDNRGRILFANDNLCEMFGYKRGELLGQPIERLVPEHLHHLHRRERGAYQRHPSKRVMGVGREVTGIRKNGEEFPAEVSLTPIDTEEGQISLAIVADISSRVKSQEDLRRYADRLEILHGVDRAILQSRPSVDTAVAAVHEMRKLVPCQRAGILTVDEETGATNLIAVEGLGVREIPPGSDYSAEKVIGNLGHLRQGRVRKIPDISKASNGPILRALEQLGLRSYIAIPMMVGDNLIGVMTLWYTQRGHRPEPEIAIASEIAAQLAVAMRQDNLLKEITAHAESLEAEVQQRTAELKERNDDLQAFAYSVSHDLRAPLRAMRGFGEALLEDYGDVMDDLGQDFISRIMTSAEQMDDLIQDLLAYSRVTQDQITVEPIVLSSVVRDVMIMIESDVEATGASIDTVGLDIKVLGHRNTLVQVLSNLISNGFKFSRDDVAPRVKVMAKLRNGWCRITVKDNGIGIRKDHQERIFRMFERLHTRDQFPGTGIGLAIVKRSMDRLGGACGVESTEGKGSTFWVELPAA